MRLIPYGACGTVTGSCHLVVLDDARVLLDCGLYQGEVEERNEEPFGFDPATIDAVVITHAHLDHIGRLPRLVHEGFRGPVLATAATHALIEPMLEDALGIMVEDRRRRARHGEDPGPQPWDEEDLELLASLAEELPYYRQRPVGVGRIELRNAGHLPGSAFVQVEADGRRLVYSGDLGNRRKEVLPDPDYASPADLVLTEATYGDRNHRPLQQTVEEFADLLTEILGRDGKVIIPSFALERTQELLFYLRELETDDRIPVAPVYLDSPLAIEITRLYDRLRDIFGLRVRSLYDQGVDPFRPHDLTFTHSVSESKRLNTLDGPATIIAGSGMFSGGRILQHLLHHLDDARNCLVIVGYQPRGGLGRRLIEEPGPVRIMGRRLEVRAQIATLGGFSAHAGRDELLDWLAGHDRVALVHGEDDTRMALQEALKARDQPSVLARFGEPIEV